MSYCRWSSDDFQCDVYVYDGGGGWTTHVAGNRPVGAVPATPEPNSGNFQEFMAAHRAQMAFLETCERANITLPHAGESFHDDTPGECADRLDMLRALGYKVPQYAIDELRLEQAQASE
jgi:hypothetical protein